MDVPGSALEFIAPARWALGEPRSLDQAVQAAVQALEETALKPPVRHMASLAFQPRVMVALLSFHYARQVYSSQEIEVLLAADITFKNACRGELPTAAMLKEFRNENRRAIRECLRAALLFLARQQLEAGAPARLDEASVADEANRRLIMAMCVDSLEPVGKADPLAP